MRTQALDLDGSGCVTFEEWYSVLASMPAMKPLLTQVQQQ